MSSKTAEKQSPGKLKKQNTGKPITGKANTGKASLNKAKILAAASKLFLQGGSEALSVRAIARQAGVSTIGIYSHFDGKQGILDALYIEGFEMVSAVLDVPTESTPALRAPLPALLRAASNYLELAKTHEAHYRLIFGDRQRDYQPSDEARRVGADAFARLTETVGRALPANTSKKKQQDAAIQVWSLLHGSASLRQHDVSLLVDMRSWQKRVLEAVEILLRGQFAA
ncbi:MAG: TetR family transcriptional regulator [Pseudomonadales bacterium]